MEEGMNRIENVLLNNAPKLLIKECWNPIRASAL